MIEFYYPELLLVGVPLAFLFWRYARSGPATTVIRALVALLLLFAIAGPLRNLGGRGIDVLVVAAGQQQGLAQAQASPQVRQGGALESMLQKLQFSFATYINPTPSEKQKT